MHISLKKLYNFSNYLFGIYSESTCIGALSRAGLLVPIHYKVEEHHTYTYK